jgi:hypothetical protein
MVILFSDIVQHFIKLHTSRKRGKDFVLVIMLLIFQKLNDQKVQEQKKYIEYYVVLDNGEVIISDKGAFKNLPLHKFIHNVRC